MKSHPKKLWVASVVLATTSCAWQGAQAQTSTAAPPTEQGPDRAPSAELTVVPVQPHLSVNFLNKTLTPSADVVVEWSTEQELPAGFGVMLGTEDVTVNYQKIGRRLEGRFTGAPMPSGKHVLKVFAVDSANQWREIAQLDMVVADGSGATQTEPVSPAQVADPAVPTEPPAAVAMVKPSLVLGVKAQLAQRHSDARQAPARATYQDLTAVAGVQTEHTQARWGLKSQFNFAGSSYGPEAVAFGSLGGDAPKLDLANYQVEGHLNSDLGASTLALGHIQAGSHSLLASGIGNRGLAFTHKFGGRVDVAAAVQSGAQAVGTQSLLGLSDPDHRMTTASAGIELLERAGGFRVETSLFEGSMKPRLSSGVATLQDAESSRGWGARAKSQSESGRLRGELAFARSTYTPKGDSALNIAPGPSASGNTWTGDLAYDLVKDLPLSSTAPQWTFSLGTQLRHEFASLAYKSLGAGQGANYASDALSMNASLHVITAQVQLTQRSDNVENLAALLKNRSNGHSLTLAAPLGQLMDVKNPPWWAPAANLTHSRTHSRADPGFIPTGQTAANLSDVLASSDGLGLNWTVDKLTLGLSTTQNEQDNRQLGFEQMDTSDRTRGMTAAYQLSEQFSVSSNWERRRALAHDTGTLRHNSNWQGSVNWGFGTRYTLTSNLSRSREHDSTGASDNRSLQWQWQLGKSFDVTAWGKAVPGQWRVSYSLSNTHAPGLSSRLQALSATLSLSLF